jgi:predicted HTH transcriptional regulator
MGLPDPQFKEQGEFVVSFWRKSATASACQRPQSEMPFSDAANVVEENALESVVRPRGFYVSPGADQLKLPLETGVDVILPNLSVEEKTALSATQRQELALKYIRKYGSITHKLYQELTGASETSTTRDLKALMGNGAVRQIGRGPGRKYVI